MIDDGPETRDQPGERVGGEGSEGGHPAWCSPEHCYVTDDGVRVHEQARAVWEDDAAEVRFESRLGDPADDSNVCVELYLRDLRFVTGGLHRVLLPMATARRLGDELTAHLNAVELSWYLRSGAGRDIHRGVLSREGMVSAVCSVRFRPQGRAGCPPDPERVRLACCRVMPG